MSDNRRVHTRYERELDSLVDAFGNARTPSEGLVDAIGTIGSRAVRFVGSGGSLAVAQLASDLHKSSTRVAAWPTTPLMSIREPTPLQSAFVLFSSSGKNPDAAAALSAAKARGHAPVMMVSQNLLSNLPERVQRLNPIVLTISAPRDGFLATGSVMATSTALVSAYGHALPTAEDMFVECPQPVSFRERIIVLYDWGLKNVALDIETRLAELGLASVQFVDYRNFAHGRHVGFNRNQASTTILALADPASQEIAERTLSELPSETEVVMWLSRFSWPVSALDLLTRSCRLPVFWGLCRMVPGGWCVIGCWWCVGVAGGVDRVGLSLAGLFKMFGDDAAGEAWFVEQRWPGGVCCPDCGCGDVLDGAVHRSQRFRCRSCGKAVLSAHGHGVGELRCRVLRSGWWPIYLVCANLKGHLQHETAQGSGRFAENSVVCAAPHPRGVHQHRRSVVRWSCGSR